MSTSSRKIPKLVFTVVLVVIVFIAGALVGIVTYRTWLLRHKVPHIIPRRIPSSIGVIRLYGYMLSDSDRELYVKSVSYALRNNSIAAVVIRIDSPGGYASIVEDIYRSVLLLRSQKPVVAVVDGIAASGGYYVALGADFILAEPSSFVGNIGVIVYAPPLVIPSEGILESGPYKYTGFSLREFPFIVKQAYNNFVEALRENRGNKLKTSMSNVTTGKLYIGISAFKLGLVDGLGSFLDALNLAAEMANITQYNVVDITAIIAKRLNITSIGTLLWRNSTRLSLNLLRHFHNDPMGVYYLAPYYINSGKYLDVVEQYVPPSPWYPQPTKKEFPLDLSHAVLVDESHGNAFNPVIFNVFFGLFVKYGYKVILIDSSMNLTSLLSKMPKALVIFTPTREYSPDEIKAIKTYVEEGGKLMLVYDPSVSFATYINSISQEFGMLFSNGYLYNLKKNYGIYRNIIITNFTECSIMRGVNKIVLFTATHIYTSYGIAFTSSDTYLSFTEAKGVYTPIAMNGNVLGIGDMSFMMDPFCEIADNKKLIELSLIHI